MSGKGYVDLEKVSEYSYGQRVLPAAINVTMSELKYSNLCPRWVLSSCEATFG